MGIKTQMKEYPVLPKGEYQAVTTTITEIEDKFGQKYEWKFKLTEAGTEDFPELRGNVFRVLQPNNKLHKWIIATGSNVDEAGNVDFDTCLNKPVRILVDNKISKTTSRPYNIVIDVMTHQKTIPASTFKTFKPPVQSPASSPNVDAIAQNQATPPADGTKKFNNF